MLRVSSKVTVRNDIFSYLYFSQLSFEEEEKRRIRRERNKIAAFKCRQRRKEHMQKLQDVSGQAVKYCFSTILVL